MAWKTLKLREVLLGGVAAAGLLAAGPTALAQIYTKADGTSTNDLNAAARSWRDDPEFKAGTQLGSIKAEYAYAMGFTGRGVKVGIFDTGVFGKHPEFAGPGKLTGLLTQGTYAYTYANYYKAGDPFSLTGTNPTKGVGLVSPSDHGTHVAGTVAANRDGVGMMGVAFGASLVAAHNSDPGPEDGVVAGNDANAYTAGFKALAASDVRIINNSWGIGFLGSLGTMGGRATISDVLAQYASAPNDGTMNAAAEIGRAGILYVKSAGNKFGSEPDALGALPYFRPDIEKSWITVANLASSNPADGLAWSSSICGMTKYYCISALGSSIYSTVFDGKGDAATAGYDEKTGTSMAAPAVAGALAITMERYPYLGNEAVRTILLTTASHQGAGPADVPNTIYGWGALDLQKAMDGPGQLLGRFVASLPAGTSDTWRNDISEAALVARKGEERAEVAAWTSTGKAAIEARIQPIPPVPPAVAPPAELISGMPQARALLRAAIDLNYTDTFDPASFAAAIAALEADPVGRQLLAAYEAVHPNWQAAAGRRGDFDAFVAGRTDTQIAEGIANAPREPIIAANKAIIAANKAAGDELVLTQARIDHLSSKTDADYVGSLVKAGDGTLTLFGKNSYSGGTFLTGGTLGVGSSTALGTGLLAMADRTTLLAAADGLSLANPVAITGTGRFDTQGFGLTLAGTISDGAGPGSLAKLGTGALTLTGVNTYTGETAISAGTLTLAGQGSIANSSRVLTEAGASFDIAATSAGASIRSLTGAGNVALGNRPLTLTAAQDVFSGAIAGSGGLTLSGGYQKLTGTSSYTGETIVSGGLLGVDGSIASSRLVSVQAGGALGGTGSVGSTLVNAGGLLTPGNSIGTLTIRGDLAMAAGSTYLVELDRSASDLTKVTGTATIAGARVATLGDFTVSRKYAILTAAGGVSGSFTTGASPFVFLTPHVGYDARNAYFSIDQTRSFASAGASRNQMAAAGGLESLGPHSALYDLVAKSTELVTPRRAFDAVSGEAHASARTALVQDSQFVRDIAVNRLRQGFGAATATPIAALAFAETASEPRAAYAGATKGPLAPSRGSPPPVPSFAMWGQGFGSWGETDRDGNAGRLRRSVGGFLAGVDAPVAESWRLGLLGGYSRSDFSVRDRASSGDSDNYHLGLYGGAQWGPLGLRLGAAYTFHDIRMSRSIAFGSFGNATRTGYDAGTAQVFGELGYRLDYGPASFEPYVNLAHVSLRSDAFREIGGAAALTGSGERLDTTFSTLGLRGSTTVMLGAVPLTLHAGIGWRHAFGEVVPAASVALAGGAPFSVAGAAIARNAAVAEAGLNMALGPNASLSVTYNGQFSGRSTDNSVRGNLAVRF
ncbi:autotransporter domain-containing protein [Bosea sp. F3-2]|uniref:autotransporter serine protease n=1 Tax=Bosea sp. F3-2 TaxID=2599640 RepID=UPI0011F01614|nr:autotransporter serine protease [Bosea sp. F3-2]QEL24776.1 autotransporter domain-containing protein [Bosea sp. F3-2]